jgi:hypothetical protein
MASRPGMILASIAVGAVFAISALSPASAQPQGFGDYPVIYRPAKDAKDLRAVLFNWTWYMGMLRGVDEHELISSLEYQGKGANLSTGTRSRSSTCGRTRMTRAVGDDAANADTQHFSRRGTSARARQLRGLRD